MLFHFLFKLSVPLIALLTIFCVAAALSGTSRPPNPVLAGFAKDCDDKLQPCWYGIVPGKTNVGDVKTILLNLKFDLMNQYPLDATYSSQVYRNNNFPCIQVEVGITSKHPNLADGLWLDSCIGVSLGDVTTSFGEPDHLNLSGLGYESRQIAISLPFHLTPDSNYCQDLMPEGKIQAFGLGTYNLYFRDDFNIGYAWHGLLPYGVYVQKYGFPSCKILGQI